MKKIIRSYILSFTLLLSQLVLCNAAVPEDIVASITIGNPVMTVNGTDTEIDPGRGTSAVIVNDRTLIPIRSVIESFGGEVLWDDATRTASLYLDGDSAALTLGSADAYINNSPALLDTVPAVINDRTMMPLRFIAEGFGLGVAWDGETKTVYLVKNGFDEAEYNALTSHLPRYSGKPYCEVFDNKPQFKEYEIINASFEYYSKLDRLNRCDVAFSSVAKDIMPTEDRESISSVTPSGWINASYDNISGRYLYNRCHLIGFQLTGENANKRNLITGTRYLNIDGMLPFENMLAEYINETDGRVLYRVTPVFSGDNLVCDGVLLEAYSPEDNGEGISFCVFCYNVQPGITIDYLTGKSAIGEIVYEKPENNEEISPEPFSVYRTPSGKKYHYDKNCGGKNSYETTLSEAVSQGLTPCSKCAK